jgi:hypothetical protein
METLKCHEGIVSYKSARDERALHWRDDVVQERPKAIDQTLGYDLEDNIAQANWPKIL